MSDTGLGVALRALRTRRTFSVRELGKLSDVDHAYIHRLETGEKTNPSADLIQKILKALKPNERDSNIVRWLMEHPDADPALVEFVLNDPTVELETFTVAAGTRHRGSGRPDPAVLIQRVQRALRAFDDED